MSSQQLAEETIPPHQVQSWYEKTAIPRLIGHDEGQQEKALAEPRLTNGPAPLLPTSALFSSTDIVYQSPYTAEPSQSGDLLTAPFSKETSEVIARVKEQGVSELAHGSPEWETAKQAVRAEMELKNTNGIPTAANPTAARTGGRRGRGPRRRGNPIVHDNTITHDTIVLTPVGSLNRTASAVSRHHTAPASSRNSIAPSSSRNPIAPANSQNSTAPVSPEQATVTVSPEQPTTVVSPKQPTVIASPEQPTAIVSPEQPPAIVNPEHHTASASSEHPTGPASFEHSTAPANFEHPTASASSEHPTTPASFQNPSDPVTSQSPIAPASPQNPTLPVNSQPPIAPAITQSSIAPAVSQSSIAPASSQQPIAPAISQTSIAPAIPQHYIAPAVPQHSIAPETPLGTPSSSRGRGRGSRLRVSRGGRSSARSSLKRKRTRGSDDDGSLSSSSEEFTSIPAQSRSGRKIVQPSNPTSIIKIDPDELVSSPASLATPVSGKFFSKKKVVKRTPGASAVCKNCGRGHSPASNAIVFCDGCNTPWHQYCHDPPIKKEYLLIADKDWFCADCVILREERGKLQGKVPGDWMGLAEKRKYLQTLSHNTLVSLLLHASSLHPTLPIYPPKTYIPITPNPLAPLGAERTVVEEEYVSEEELPYPKAGNGIQLPPEHEDQDILLDTDVEVFSHRWEGIPQMLAEVAKLNSGSPNRNGLGVRTGNTVGVRVGA